MIDDRLERRVRPPDREVPQMPFTAILTSRSDDHATRDSPMRRPLGSSSAALAASPRRSARADAKAKAKVTYQDHVSPIFQNAATPATTPTSRRAA